MEKVDGVDMVRGVLGMGPEERERANRQVIDHLHSTLGDGRKELAGLRWKLSATYFVIVVLSIVMFAIGVVLLSVPASAAFGGRISEMQSVISAGFGIADLAALFLFRPLDRVHKLMGDMSQLVIAVNSYQTQLGLRLLEMNTDDRATVGKAAEGVNAAAKDAIKSIQVYFERPLG